MQSLKSSKQLSSLKNTNLQNTNLQNTNRLRSIQESSNKLFNTTKNSAVNNSVDKSVDITSEKSNKLSSSIGYVKDSFSNAKNKVISSSNNVFDKNNIKDRFEYVKENYVNKKIVLGIVIIIILGIIGLNIFKYLSNGIDYIKELTSPLINVFADISKKAAITSSENIGDGASEIIKTTSKTSKNIVDTSKEGSLTSITALQKTINTDNDNNYVEDDDVEDDDVDYDNDVTIKSGYCFVGKSKNRRYCSKLDSKSECMSGDIYPTLEKCINPNLR
tara:strand:+ start:1689 stop:2513 length:825 start_codon:yes stop_codon:yes gene_type:complete